MHASLFTGVFTGNGDPEGLLSKRSFSRALSEAVVVFFDRNELRFLAIF